MDRQDVGSPLGAMEGVRILFEGARMLAREPRLWLPAAIPVALSLLSFSLAVICVVTYASEMHELAAGWLPEMSADRWYEWLWVGPGLFLLRAVGWLLFLVVAAAVMVVAYMLASLLAAPFHDWLAYRVEELAAGTVRDATSGGFGGTVADIGRSLLQELKRLVFFLSLVGSLAVAGFLIPGAQLLTGPAIVVITVLFLPLDYASYALDRRLVPFDRKRRWLFEHLPVMLGFGSGAFVTCLVPGLNFVAMPLLVVAGTLLCLRHDPDAIRASG